MSTHPPAPQALARNPQEGSGGRVLMCEQRGLRAFDMHHVLVDRAPQQVLAHKKLPTPPGRPYGSRHRATVGSWEGGVSYERGTPVEGCARSTCTTSSPPARPNRS